MQTGYFNAAWHDVKNSPGWFGKVLTLALVGMIPVFGWIVVAGYLYGWARDIAWGVRAPLPPRVFGNEDGQLYSRGFFIVVIGFVCMFLVFALCFFGSIVTGMGFGFSGVAHHRFGGALAFPLGAMVGIVALVFAVVQLALFFAATFFQWVGAMRASIYGRLSAGLQLGRVWAMIRHDFGGLLRIFGMNLLLAIAASLVMSVLAMLLVLAMALMFFATGISAGGSGAATVGMAMVVAGASLLLLLAICYAAMVLGMFAEMLVVRALGYWMRQFDVPHWRGQDDPMPFELAGAAGGATGKTSD